MYANLTCPISGAWLEIAINQDERGKHKIRHSSSSSSSMLLVKVNWGISAVATKRFGNLKISFNQIWERQSTVSSRACVCVRVYDDTSLLSIIDEFRLSLYIAKTHILGSNFSLYGGLILPMKINVCGVKDN